MRTLLERGPSCFGASLLVAASGGALGGIAEFLIALPSPFAFFAAWLGTLVGAAAGFTGFVVGGLVFAVSRRGAHQGVVLRIITALATALGSSLAVGVVLTVTNALEVPWSMAVTFVASGGLAFLAYPRLVRELEG